jgi:hypothetical protein
MPAFSCGFDRGFDAEVCEEETPATGGSGGVGVLVRPKRRRPDCADLSGELWIAVIGVGHLEAEPSAAAVRKAFIEKQNKVAIIAAAAFLLLDNGAQSLPIVAPDYPEDGRR